MNVIIIDFLHFKYTISTNISPGLYEVIFPEFYTFKNFANSYNLWTIRYMVLDPNPNIIR